MVKTATSKIFQRDIKLIYVPAERSTKSPDLISLYKSSGCINHFNNIRFY